MQYVALLRGINVGGKNTIKMSELKSCFETLGFLDVATYINSGNIIFTSDKPERKLGAIIEQCIIDNFNLNVPVIVRSQAHIQAVVEALPKQWVNDQTMRTDILFLWEAVDFPKIINEIKINPEVDNLIYTPGAIIWQFDRINYTKTGMRNFIGTRVYKLMTARNANTVRKLRELMQAST